MTHTILNQIAVPLFATVEIMGHERYDAALVTEADLYGAKLIGITFFYTAWHYDEGVEGSHVRTVETKYYGPQSIFSLKPMPTSGARVALGDDGYSQILRTLPGDMLVVWTLSPLEFKTAGELLRSFARSFGP